MAAGGSFSGMGCIVSFGPLADTIPPGHLDFWALVLSRRGNKGRGTVFRQRTMGLAAFGAVSGSFDLERFRSAVGVMAR
jgi:hypothetical protein